jgi:hypothetical protein
LDRTVLLEESLPDDSFTVTNSGPGMLNYTITDDAGWLSVSPETGDSTGEPDTITISYDVAGLAAGPYTGHIDVASGDADNSPQRLTVNLTVQGPTIVLSDSVLDRQAYLGESPAAETFTVTNGGGGVLNYTISDDATWLSVAPTGGDSAGEADVIDLTYDTTLLEAGVHTAHVEVESLDADNSPEILTINVTMSPIGPDFDGDRDVDLEDFGRLQACLTANSTPITDPNCLPCNLDGDDDVDQSDYSIFANCLTGADIPADSSCLPQ